MPVPALYGTFQSVNRELNDARAECLPERGIYSARSAGL